MTASALLAQVVRDGRFLTGESPERVAATLDLGNRTIRRLEAGQVKAPRSVTLEALASYYALDADFLKWLAGRQTAGDELVADLLDWARRAGVEVNERNPRRLALALARAGGRRHPTATSDDAQQVLAEYLALDRSRRAVARTVLAELRLAQCEARRRREGDTDT